MSDLFQRQICGFPHQETARRLEEWNRRSHSMIISIKMTLKT